MKKSSLQTLLATSQKRIQLRPHKLFEDVQTGTYRTTEWGKFLDVDQSLADMLGYPDRESLMAVGIDRLYADAHDLLRWQYLMARKGVLLHLEVLMRRRDGSTVLVSDSARAIRDEDGRLLYYEGMLEEIGHPKPEGMERELLTQAL